MGQAEIDGSNEESEMIPALNTTRLMIHDADDKQLFIHDGDISYARYETLPIHLRVVTVSLLYGIPNWSQAYLTPGWHR